MERFTRRYGNQVEVQGIQWSYYRLGAGTPVLWLTGGLRRAAAASAFLESLSRHHTVIAPDYAPVPSIAEFMAAFDEILRRESVDAVTLVGQSYGGMLAQAYLAHRPQAVTRLVLSSSGPVAYARRWVPAAKLGSLLARVLPERLLKKLLAAGLARLARPLPQQERAQMSEVIRILLHEKLSRADVVSHFAVAADVIRSGMVEPAAFRGWHGDVVVLSAENDPTQRDRDMPKYEWLFGRRPQLVSLGQLGHAAVLTAPDRYVELLEGALE
ncbi:MAG: alpha/beta hydrolase [Mycobacterium sp.]|nr:MAG: alpha/beta hydrolase [Mycobacterium sp.]